MIVFRMSDIDINIINDISLELAVFHEKLKNKIYERNGILSEGRVSKYNYFLEKYELRFINKKKLETYSRKIEYINVINIELQANILTYCIIVRIFINVL